MRKGWIVVGLALAGLLSPAIAGAQNLLPEFPTQAGVAGDQLFFFYDTRTDRTTFITIGNVNTDGVVVEIVWYSQALDRLAEEVLAIEGGGTRVIDPTLVPDVPGNAGLAQITPIVGQFDHRPIVPESPLVGGFTIVNVPLGAGFGQNPFGRLAQDVTMAVGTDAPRAAAGSIVDGSSVFYQNIRPRAVAPSLVIPAYFNPMTLSPPEMDGNRVFLAAFTDHYNAPVGPGGDARFNISAITVNTFVSFFDRTGNEIVMNRPVDVTGVRLDNLQGLSGGATLDQPGKVEITNPAFASEFDNFFGLFSQALGTFAVGQTLVAIDFP